MSIRLPIGNSCGVKCRAFSVLFPADLHHLWKFLDERIALDDQARGVLDVNDCATMEVSSFFVPDLKKYSMNKDDIIRSDHNDDGIDRKGFIKCMAWAGTGVLWLMSGGSLKALGMSQLLDKNTNYDKKSYRVELGVQRFDDMYLHSRFNSQGQLEGGRIEYVSPSATGYAAAHSLCLSWCH